MKKVIFISNFLNHHQFPICEAFLRYTDFKFIATMPVPKDRLEMGYENMNENCSFVVKTYDFQKESLIQMINEADIVITGGKESMPYVYERLKLNKITFQYSERLYRKGIIRRLNPRAFHHVNDLFLKYKKNSNFFVLTSSCYTSFDLSLWKFPVEKCLKWGYFPKTEYSLTDKGNEPIKILWVGRLIELKHPETVITIAKHLKKKNISYNIIVIGDGPKKDNLVAESKELNISYIGFINPNEVYNYMKKSNIFLFTSDYREGWGAVLNEGMSSGCACVASTAAGSSNYLINDGINGYLYSWDNMNELCEKVETLVSNNDKRNEISHNAVTTMKNLWNADIAVKRLLDFVDNGCDVNMFSDGPVSNAEIFRSR